MSALRRNGSTAQWRKLRALILNRDHHTCHWCGRYATHVDHILPRSLGGTDNPRNLVASCAKCNLTRNAKRSRKHSAPRTVWAGALDLEGD